MVKDFSWLNLLSVIGDILFITSMTYVGFNVYSEKGMNWEVWLLLTVVIFIILLRTYNLWRSKS